MLQPVPSTAMAALATSTTTATTTGSPRATRAPPSPSRKSKLPAFLTPPLMRKRKHILDANFSTSLPSTTQSATASPSHKGSGGKSPGFFSLLKAKFDRNSRKSSSSHSVRSGHHSAEDGARMASSSAVLHQLDAAPEISISNGLFNTKYATLLSREGEEEPVGSSTLSDHGGDVALANDDWETSQALPPPPPPLPPPPPPLLPSPPPTPPLSLMPRLTRRVSSFHRRITSSNVGHPSTSAADPDSNSSPSIVMPTISSSHESSAPLLAACASTAAAAAAATAAAAAHQRSIVGPYRLHIVLRQGRDLAAKDTCGTSDPYVKFKMGNKVIHKSKTIYRDLNPTWDEDFDVTVDDLGTPLQVRVFDYDWGLQDDFLGSALLDLNRLDVNKLKAVTLELYSDECDGLQGYIDLAATLYVKCEEEVVDNKNQTSKINEQARKLKVQIWSSVVNILIIEGKRLVDKEGDPLSKPYLRLRLGNEKHKTKSATWNTSCTAVTWLEQFDFHLFEEQTHLLEIHLFDKDPKGKEEAVGRAILDLTDIEGELTHSLTCQFQNGLIGSVSLLVTISGTTASETISDLSSTIPDALEISTLQTRYALYRTLENTRDVGHLSVKVFRATGLASTDIGGKSDPFCVLQLVNSRLQTQTEYKTLNPNWNKIFTFNVKDINSVLEVTVYDEDRDHRVDFIGKVCIPLLRIRNSQKKWYVLKDRKLRCRAKGSNPKILLDLDVTWNYLRASFNTLQPKEKKYIEPEVKFSRHTFIRNVMRIKTVVMDIIQLGKFIESCWEWDSTLRSIIAFVVFLLVTWYFEPFVLPLMLLFYFLHSFLFRSFGNANLNEYESDGSVEDDDDDPDDKNKEEKKSLKEKLQAVQEVTLTVQHALGTIASLMESVKNTFNFSVPYLSYLAIFLLMVASLVLYAIPLRIIILGWGINKFTRKLLRPHSIPNNELLDFMSRVPDDEEMADYREIRTEVTADAADKSARRGTRRK